MRNEALSHEQGVQAIVALFTSGIESAGQTKLFRRRGGGKGRNHYDEAAQRTLFGGIGSGHTPYRGT